MSDTHSFDDVNAAESRWIEQRRLKAGVAPAKPRVGVAFSGGGIRSACFHLGFLEALIEAGKMKQVDFLSTVSGGGYIGSCFQWLKHQAETSDNDHLFSQRANGGNVLGWLRAHGKYLIDGKGVNSMTLFAALLASTLFNLLIVLPVLLFVIWLFGLPHAAVQWPQSWHMPGADQIEGHVGYLLALGFSGFFLSLYLLVIPTMAFWRQRIHSHNFAPRRWMGNLLTASLVLALIGSLPMVAQLGDMLVAMIGEESIETLGKHLSYLLPLIGGATALKFGALRPKLAMMGITLLLYGITALCYHLVFHVGLVETTGFWVWLGVALVLAAFASINRTSMHSYYLARLCNAFFVRKEGNDRDHSGDMLLCNLNPDTGAPLPLINTTLTTRNSKKRLWRDRLGASFTLSPLYCGSPVTGFAKSEDFQSGRMTLGESMTTSGAAVDPGTAQTANWALSFLMALLNFRLGFWTKAPRAAGARFSHMPYWLIFREMFGIGMSETESNIHLTDGGHFENLGVYELLRRELPVIIAGDAGADPDTNLSDLQLLIQHAIADFDCLIKIDVDELMSKKGNEHNSCFATGRIHYASGKEGVLIYVKSLLTPESPTLLKSFALTDNAFPNDSTADQFFDEMHFDAYRVLGKFNLHQALNEHPTLFDGPA